MANKKLIVIILAILGAVLLLLIVMKLTTTIENPAKHESENAPAVRKQTPAKTATAKKTPGTAVSVKPENISPDKDMKIQRLIDELVSLNSKQPMIAQTEGVISELCGYGDSAIPSIKKLLASDANSTVKSAAARVLAQIGSAESVETLVNFIDSETNPASKDLYIRTIQAVDKADASPSLIKALESSKDIYFSTEIKQAIARTGNEDTVKQLVEACHAQNESNAQIANLLGALSTIRLPEAIPALSSAAATDQSPNVRKNALQALSGMGYPDSTQALVNIYISEKNTDRKSLVLSAIGSVNGKESLDYLRDVYSNKRYPEELRKAAARAIFVIKNGVPPAE